MLKIVFAVACVLVVAAMVACSRLFICMCDDLKENWLFGKVLDANFFYYFLHIAPFVVSAIAYLSLIGFGAFGIIEMIKVIVGVQL